MTDAITDAVRRLKQLQQDVERLKAGQDEEGEPRLFVSEDDLAVGRDESAVRASNIATTDTATATDTGADTTAESVTPAYWNDANWNTSEYPE